MVITTSRNIKRFVCCKNIGLIRVKHFLFWRRCLQPVDWRRGNFCCCLQNRALCGGFWQGTRGNWWFWLNFNWSYCSGGKCLNIVASDWVAVFYGWLSRFGCSSWFSYLWNEETINDTECVSFLYSLRFNIFNFWSCSVQFVGRRCYFIGVIVYPLPILEVLVRDLINNEI